MSQPLISVVMATYNHADFVKQAIDSVLTQQGVNFEFLIADDGSQDSTRTEVASIRDRRIAFFPNKINQGACIVTNELIEKASGQFIALINSDDYWNSTNKLANQVQIMQDNPALGACFGKVNFVDKEDMTLSKESLPFGHIFDQKNRSQGHWLNQFFNLGNCICHPTMLIRKSCYNELGMYNNRLRQLPDLEMWIRLVKKYPIFIMDQELINFRILPGENASSQTIPNSIRTMNEHYLIAEKFFDNVTKEHLIDGFSDQLIYKNIPTIKHLEIEKTLLYFKENQWLGRPYKLIGLIKMNHLLNEPDYYDLLDNDYQINDRWFQQQMGDIDVLRSKLTATLSQKKSSLHKVVNRILSPIKSSFKKINLLN